MNALASRVVRRTLPPVLMKMFPSLRSLLLFLCGGAAGAGLLHWLRPQKDPGAAAGPAASAPAMQTNLPADAGATGPAQVVVTPESKTVLRGQDQRAKVDLLRAAWDDRNPFASTTRLQQMIMQLDAAGLAALAKETEDDFWWSDPGATKVRQLTLERWSETNPGAALDYAAGLRGFRAWGTVETVFRTAALQDRAAALAAYQKMPAGFGARNAASAIVEAVAAKDPRGALAMLDGKQIKGGQQMLGSVLAAWARTDPLAAGAEWQKRSASPGASNALSGLMVAWAERDPEGAFAWSRSLTKGSDRRSAVESCLAKLAGRDAQAALRMAESLPPGERAGALPSVIYAWSQDDPDAAEAWALARKNPLERSQMLARLANNMDFADPERAARLARELPKGDQRTSFLQQAMGYLSYSDDDEAMQRLIDGSQGEERRKLRESMLYSISWSDPDKVKSLLKEQPPDDPADQVWNRVAGNLATRDPEKALEWARSLSDPVTQRTAINGVFENWAYNAPDNAAAEAVKLTDPAARENAMQLVANAWAGQDHAAALRWAEGLGGKDRDTVLGAVLQESVKYQPSETTPHILEALRSVPEGSLPGDTLIRAASTAAGNMAAEDPAGAAAWAQALPDEKSRVAVTGQVASAWADQDPKATSQWITTLPAGEARDQAVGQLVPHIVESEPESAFAWGVSVQDAGVRDRIMEQTLGHWKRIDAAAAEAAIRSAGFSASETEKWLKRVK